MTVVFEPTALEVHRYVSTWFDDQAVYAFVAEHHALISRPSVRLYTRAREQREAGRPWKKRTLEMMAGDEQMLRLAELLIDPRYANNTQRQQAFETAGGRKRTQFYELLKRFKENKEAAGNWPRIELASAKEFPRLAE